MKTPIKAFPNGPAADQGDGYNLTDDDGVFIGNIETKADAEAIVEAVNGAAAGGPA